MRAVRALGTRCIDHQRPGNSPEIQRRATDLGAGRP